MIERLSLNSLKFFYYVARYEQMESMLRSGNMDDFEEKMQQYVAAGGNPQSFFASLPQRLQAEFLSRQQALGMKATTPGSVLRYQERQ